VTLANINYIYVDITTTTQGAAMPHVRPEPIAPENSGSPSSLGGKPAPMPELKHVDPPQSSVDDNMSIGTADKPRAMPDVQFDDGASDNLRNALNSAADTILCPDI